MLLHSVRAGVDLNSNERIPPRAAARLQEPVAAAHSEVHPDMAHFVPEKRRACPYIPFRSWKFSTRRSLARRQSALPQRFESLVASTTPSGPVPKAAPAKEIGCESVDADCGEGLVSMPRGAPGSCLERNSMFGLHGILQTQVGSSSTILGDGCLGVQIVRY